MLNLNFVTDKRH